MKKQLLYLTLFLGSLGLQTVTQGAVTQIKQPFTKQQFSFKPVAKLENSNRISGWLQIPANGKAFITLNPGEKTPKYDPKTGKDNFEYTNPAYPTITLPAGLYFWKTPKFTPEIGTRKKYWVQHRPGGKHFIFNTSKGNYEDACSHKTWDPKGHQKHPF